MSDSNTWLIDTYIAVREDWQRVATILDSLPNTKADFLKLRKTNPETLEPFQRAAHFIYLNKTCFRGLYRVNRSNQFNVPYGGYDRRYYDSLNLDAASQALKKAEIRKGDFELSLRDVTKNDFVYFDPPYYKLGGYSDFNRYTPGQFREGDQMRLSALCRELDNRGVRWAVSNSNTEFITELFSGYNCIKIANRREINLKSQDRNVEELLIVNFDEGRHLFA